MTTYRLKFNDERLTQKTLTIDNGGLCESDTRILTKMLVRQFVSRYLDKQKVAGVFSAKIKGKTIHIDMYKPQDKKK